MRGQGVQDSVGIQGAHTQLLFGVVFAMFHFVCVFFLNSDDSHVLRCLFVVFVMLSCQKSRLIAVFARSNEVGIVGPIIRVLLPS